MIQRLHGETYAQLYKSIPFLIAIKNNEASGIFFVIILKVTLIWEKKIQIIIILEQRMAI